MTSYHKTANIHVIAAARRERDRIRKTPHSCRELYPASTMSPNVLIFKHGNPNTSQRASNQAQSAAPRAADNPGSRVHEPVSRRRVRASSPSHSETPEPCNAASLRAAAPTVCAVVERSRDCPARLDGVVERQRHGKGRATVSWMVLTRPRLFGLLPRRRQAKPWLRKMIVSVSPVL